MPRPLQDNRGHSYCAVPAHALQGKMVANIGWGFYQASATGPLYCFVEQWCVVNQHNSMHMMDISQMFQEVLQIVRVADGTPTLVQISTPAKQPQKGQRRAF